MTSDDSSRKRFFKRRGQAFVKKYDRSGLYNGVKASHLTFETFYTDNQHMHKIVQDLLYEQ